MNLFSASIISPNSLRTKILLGYALIFLLVSAFVYTYFPLRHKQQAIQAIEFRINSIIDMMSIGAGIGLGEIDLVAIEEVSNWVRKDSSLAYIIVLNQENQQVAAHHAGQPLLKVSNMLTVADGTELNRVLHYKRPLVYQGQPFGILLIGYSLHNLDRELQQQKSISLYICLGIFTSGLILSIWITHRITGNITKLGQAVNELAMGNTHAYANIDSSDEIGLLADTFNEMISKVNQSRSELLASKQFTENILMSMLDSLLVLDQYNNIVRANQAACALLGYTESEILGNNISRLFGNQQHAGLFFSSLQQNGSLESHEGVFLTKSGIPINVLFSAAILKDSQGTQLGTVCVAQDISERKKANTQLKEYSQRLEKSNRELEKFNYVVSHDLKAPLQALYKLSEWIQADTENALSEESRKNFEMLQGRIRRMELLINGLLDYSRTGRLIKMPEMVSVEQVLGEVIQELEPPAHIKVCIGSGMPTFITQRKRLQHVFIHLINNAIRFNDKPQGMIHVSVTEQDNRYVFAVADNGPGIETKYFEKVFAIFQTLSARDKVESTGIGLTIAKRIVEEHEGKIWIESVMGQGATFYFTWPKEC